MSKSSILTTSRSEPKSSASNSEPWLRKSSPKPLVFDANNSMQPTDHLAETSVTVIAAVTEAGIETIDLEENINETIDLKVATDKKAIGQEEIDRTRIDPHFVAATATKDPLIDPKAIAPLSEAETDPKVIVPPIEAAATDPVVEIDHLTVATTAEIAHPIEVAAVTDPVAAGVDSGPAVAVDVPAAVDSDPAVAADAQAAAVDSDPVVVAEGLLAETKVKATKPTKPKVSKPKESI